MGMVLLALLSLLGLTAAGTGVMEQRLATHARDRLRAFEAAEMAMLACEARLPALRLMDPIPVQDASALGISVPLAVEQPRCEVSRVYTYTGGERSMELAGHESDSYQVYRLRIEAFGASPGTRVRLEGHARERLWGSS